MKRIGFDIDGTILSNDNKYNLLREVFKGFDENIHYTIYPLDDSLKLHGFVGDEFNGKTFYKDNKEIMFGEGTFYNDFKILYNRLISEGYEIYFVTARSKEYEPYTKLLFEKNGIPYVNVYHLGSYNKVQTLLDLEIEYYFEDNINNILQILKETNVKVGFIEAPYNKFFELNNERFYDFRIWKNVLDFEF